MEPSNLERLIESQPPGKIGPRFVKLLGIASVGASLVYRDTRPTKAFLLGVAAGTIGNSLNSLVGHRQGAHGAIKLKPGITNESMRLATGVLGGIRMKGVAMHRWHHDHTDTLDDPHAPSYVGRGQVFRNIARISERFSDAHPEYVQEVLTESAYTTPKFYEKTPIFLGSVLALHMYLGKKLDIPVAARIASAVTHVSLVYAQNAMFTADVHSDDPNHAEIKTFPYGRTMNVIFGSENGHPAHHEAPGNPRLSEFDAVFAVARALKAVGLAEMPYLEQNHSQSEAV